MKNNFKPLDRLAVFTFLWACYMLVQQEYYSNWLIHMQPKGWLLTVSVISVLLFPRSILLLLLMVILGGVERALRLPGLVNHLLAELFIDIAMVGAVFAVAYQRKKSGAAVTWLDSLRLSDAAAREHFFERMAPVLRIMYVIVYAFAFVSKLNYDFFNPEISCATVLYQDLARILPIFPTGDWVDLLVIWGTVVIEAALPLSLSFRSTWKYGLLIGIPFHIILGLAGHRTFSIQAFAIYFLFVSPTFTDVINEWWLKIRVAAGRWFSPMRLAVFGIILAAMAIEIGGPEPLRTTVFFRYNRLLIWLFWSFAMIPIFVAVFSHGRAQAARMLPQPVYRLGFLWVMPMLVTLNGMSQYLGMKTEHSFTMFSNLRTEAGVNNHFFMPEWLKLTDLQDDVIEIVESDHPDFQLYRDNEQLITYFEFHRLASDLRGDFQVAYFRNGEPQVLAVKEGISNQPEITQKPPLLLAMLLRFRPISKGPCMECFH
jgi:hypothetical protein